jgi:3-oxoacyl-[acyl-carrier protein] reductase
MSAGGAVAVITGATGVIGSTLVRRLLARGMRVVAGARKSREADIVRLYGETAPGRVAARSVDVSHEGQARDLIAFAVDTFGSVDVLVNAAGTYGAIGAVVDVAPKAWKAAFDTNLMGCYSCCHYAVPHMLKAGRGSIINVAGGGSTGPLDNFSCYAASKAALARFTDTLANELKESGITANAILPGTVDSPMQDQLLAAGERAGVWYKKMKEFRDTSKGFVPVALTADLVEFLLFGRGAKLTGKLLSARYDGYSSWSAGELAAIAGTELFSLRRMDLPTLRPIFALDGGIEHFEKKDRNG